MKSKVYFIATETNDEIESVKIKLLRLLKESGILLGAIREDDSVALKLHFGEEGNTGFVRPQYVKVITQAIKDLGAKPFLIDSNTLYKGKRQDAYGHLQLAREHGFREEEIEVPIKIDDESQPASIVEIDIRGEFIQKAKTVKAFFNAQAIVGIAHFKGHLMTGFGGAIKNIGMGTASRQGKLEQHSSVSPIVSQEKCVGCEECVKLCPAQAITLTRGKAQINNDKCIGCAACISGCKQSAIDVQWEQGADTIQQKMVEYTKAALTGKQAKSTFLNFAIKITKDCDCLAKDDARVCDDLGIFASVDPLAIDKSCVDLINERSGRDLFKQLHPKRDYNIGLLHAAKIGLGTLDYELIKV